MIAGHLEDSRKEEESYLSINPHESKTPSQGGEKTYLRTRTEKTTRSKQAGSQLTQHIQDRSAPRVEPGQLKSGHKQGGRREWERGYKQVKKIDQRRSGFSLYTCKHSRNQDGPDGGSSAAMESGKSLEKEPILCHCIDQPRHGEHGTQEAGRGNGNMWGCGEAGETRASVPSLPGVRCLFLLSLNPRAMIPDNPTVGGLKTVTLTWM